MNLKAFTLAALMLAVMSCTFPKPGDTGFFEVTVGADAEDNDVGDGNCRSTLPSEACTLRAAVAESNAMDGENTIRLGERVHTLSISGSVIVSDLLNIEGSGRNATVIDGGRRGRMFTIDSANVWMSDLTITNGGDTSAGGAIAIEGGAFLTANNVVVKDSRAYTGGGGIYVQNGDLAMLDCTISGNEATGAFAGGLWINNNGRATLDRTTIVANTSNRSGGIHNSGSLKMTNSTVSGNSSRSVGRGTGGIVNEGIAHLNNVTIYNNDSNSSSGSVGSGGIFMPAVSRRTTMSNTIVANNRKRDNPDDCSGSITSYGYNLIQNEVGCDLAEILAGNIIGRDPDLFPLSYAGGAQTQSHVPRTTSPVISAGHPQVGAGVERLGRCEARDQAGRLRQLTGSGRRCEIGSIERM